MSWFSQLAIIGGFVSLLGGFGLIGHNIPDYSLLTGSYLVVFGLFLRKHEKEKTLNNN